MKVVTWTDQHGFQHRSLLRDNDPDSAAPQGIPADPPDLFRLDWEGLAKELHNLLVERGLVTWQDVQAQQYGVSNAILSVMKRPIVALYRQENEGRKQ